MSPLPEALHTWHASGRRVLADGVSLYARERGRGDWIVCIHGFPTSSWDWHRVLPGLARNHRVLVFDLPGFGLSDKPPGRDYSLLRQADAVEAVLGTFGITAFHLVAHDMGDTVSCELLHRVEAGRTRLRPRSLILLNGGIYPELHHPLPTQRMLRLPVLGELTARLASYRLFRHQYGKVYADPGAFDEAHYQAQWALVTGDGGREVLAKTAVYMRERLKHRERWLGPLERTTLPMLLLWGQEDPIAVPAIGDRLARRVPAARLLRLDGVGHYPQLEAPGRVVHEIERFLASPG